MTDGAGDPDWVVPGLAQLFETVLDAAADRRDLALAERDRFFEVGRRGSEQQLSLSGIIESYLRGAGELWEGVLDRASADQTVEIGRSLRRVSEQAVAALVSGFEAAQRHSIRAEESMRREFFDDLLGGTVPTVELAGRAVQARFAPSESFAVIVGSAGVGNTLAESGPVPGRIRRELESRDPGRGLEVLTRHGELVIVSPTVGPTDLDRVAALAVAAVGMEPLLWTVGVGSGDGGLAGIAVAYREAREAVRLAGLFDLDSPVRYDDLAHYRLLAADPEAARQLVATVIAPLAAAPRGALLETLRSYVDHGGNMAEVARALHVGARTVGYRLDRISELTGYSPRDADGWFVLALALRVHPLIGALDPGCDTGLR